VLVLGLIKKQWGVLCRYPVPQRAETQGRTEEYVGRWLKQSKYSRDHVVLATKVPLLVDSRNFLSLGMYVTYFEAETDVTED
jgi:hypothetical protein